MIKQILAAIVLLAAPLFGQTQVSGPAYRPNINPYCNMDIPDVPSGPFACPNGVDQDCIDACQKAHNDDAKAAIAKACMLYNAAHASYQLLFNGVNSSLTTCIQSARGVLERSKCIRTYEIGLRFVTRNFDDNVKAIDSALQLHLQDLIEDYWDCVSKCCKDKIVIVPNSSTAGMSMVQVFKMIETNKIWRF